MEEMQSAVDDTISIPVLEQDEALGVEEQDASFPSTSDVASAAVEALLGEMQGLRHDFDTKIKYDESKDRLISSLHRELQMYREGFHFTILRPLFSDLITMHDDLGRFIEKLDEAVSQQQIRPLQSFQESIEETLKRNGVEIFQHEGEIFLASKQRILRTVATSEPAQDKCIARRVRKGFAYEGKILRPEIVDVYRYTDVAQEQ